MLIGKDQLTRTLSMVLSQRIAQGCDLDEETINARIEAAADSYDGLYALALELRDPPIRADWNYHEPTHWDGICSESEQLQPDRGGPPPDLARASEQVRAGFLGSVCGCMLGKPLEVDPTLAELKAAAAGEAWPLDDYVSEAFLERLGRRHDSWTETCRERLNSVAADDDLHYTLLGMLLLEKHGTAFSQQDLHSLWELNLAPGWTWGPERSALLGVGIQRHHFFPDQPLEASHDVLLLNPGDEMCGALIRADAYGYACPGNPIWGHGWPGRTPPLPTLAPVCTVLCLSPHSLPSACRPDQWRRVRTVSSWSEKRCGAFQAAPAWRRCCRTAWRRSAPPTTGKQAIPRYTIATGSTAIARSTRRSAPW